MTRLSDDQIADVKARVDLAGLAQDLGARLRPSGGRLVGSCPLCGGGNAMKPWSEKAFSQTMVKKGFVKVDGRIRHFLGLQLHSVPDRPEPRSPRREDDR